MNTPNYPNNPNNPNSADPHAQSRANNPNKPYNPNNPNNPNNLNNSTIGLTLMPSRDGRCLLPTMVGQGTQVAFGQNLYLGCMLAFNFTELERVRVFLNTNSLMIV